MKRLIVLLPLLCAIQLWAQDTRRHTPTPTPIPAPAITGLSYSGGAVVNLSVFIQNQAYVITAQANSVTTSVVIKKDGLVFKTDTALPFTMEWKPGLIGSHTLVFIPKNAAGVSGTPRSVMVQVVASPTPTATPSATPSPTVTPSATPSATPTSTPTITPTPSPTPTPTGAGIASRYPNDAGIGSDPAVIFTDNFDSYNVPSDAVAHWGNGGNTGYLNRMRLATEPDHVYLGAKSMEFHLPVSTTEVSVSLYKNLIQTQDTLFFRVYQKWAPDYFVKASNHNGITLSAKYPGYAGVKPPADGTGFFLFMLQNSLTQSTVSGTAAPGYADIYAYWPKQVANYGDNWYPNGTGGPWLSQPAQYPNFKPYPNFTPQLNRWYCYELMVKPNTPGQNNGEVKYWIDGQVAGDFPNLFMRSIDTLKIDQFMLGLHATNTTQALTKWHDNVVVAKSYIGPVVKTSPTPTPSSTATATPTATPTPSASPTPSPTSTPTPSASSTPSATPSDTPTATPTATPTPSPTATPSPSPVSVVASWQATAGDSYRLYYGTATGQYNPSIDTGSTDSYTLSGLLPNTTYFFTLTAIRDGIESGKSVETVYTTTTMQMQRLHLDKPYGYRSDAR